jgi:hypothetical protein
LKFAGFKLTKVALKLIDALLVFGCDLGGLILDLAFDRHCSRPPIIARSRASAPARPGSYHLGQVRTPRVALVADARGAPARAVAGQRVKPRDDGAVAAMLVNQPVQGIATEPPALRAFDAEHVELAEQVSERGADGAGLFAHTRTRKRRKRMTTSRCTSNTVFAYDSLQNRIVLIMGSQSVTTI